MAGKWLEKVNCPRIKSSYFVLDDRMVVFSRLDFMTLAKINMYIITCNPGPTYLYLVP